MKHLTQLYNELNRQFFNGRLPRYRVTFYKAMTKQGWCISERRLIRLSPSLPDAQIRKVLLHEMCHIGTPDHGKRFQAKLARLAALGEAWANDEIRMYADNPAIPWQAEVKQQIQDILIDQPDACFWPAIRSIAYDLGITPGELLHRAPWVRATWKKARAESRGFRQHRQR
jgi:hypothetical protein